ncbi:MAG TPA: hypothetical protein VI248_03650 [Kineosporiaceae bacterium]
MLPGDLTAAEKALVSAVDAGGWAEAGGADVRAVVVAALVVRGGERPDGVAPALRLRGAVVTGTLDVSYREVAVPVHFDRCRFTAAPQLTGASTRTWECSECELPGLEARLLAVRGDLRLSGSVISGRSSLENADISGTLHLSRAKLVNPGDRALSAGGVIVGGGVVGRGGLRVDGETRFIGARVLGGILLEQAHFHRPGGVALCLDDVQTNRLRCADGFRVDGQLLLRGAQVSGEVSFHGARLHAGDRALRARGLQAGELILMPAEVDGLVDLSRAHVGALRDAAERWPAAMRLDGFTYDHLIPLGAPIGVAARCRWLDRDSEAYRPQPYQQLAAYYRRLGHDDDARRVLLAKERRRRATLHPLRRLGGYLLDALVGYGYRSWLAGAWLTVLVALGTTVFTGWAPHPLDPEHHPRFSALVYTVDLLIPIGAFGQRTAFDPVGATEWVADGLIAAGWILATALVAGVSRSLGRD